MVDIKNFGAVGNGIVDDRGVTPKSDKVKAYIDKKQAGDI